MNLTDLNRLDRAAFVALLGGVFEHSPWVADRAFDARPFASADALHAAMVAAVDAATDAEKLALLRAHPDLVGRLAREGRLTADSAAEQAAAGLSSVSADDAAAFDRYNAAYRARFGFPFVICARENKVAAILAAMPERLANAPADEVRTALAEVAKIARLRLADRISIDAMPPTITRHCYGKSRVRLTKVDRAPGRQDLKELAVDVELEGDFADAYLAGDNAKIVATDSMRNTVYALAADGPVASAEAFAVALARHFAARYPQVSAATITVRQERWDRLDAADGTIAAHPHAFVSGGAEKRRAVARADRDGGVALSSGFEGLAVVKTADSAFAGYVRDEFTTLPETADRVFGTVIDATWAFADAAFEHDYDAAFAAARSALLGAFAAHRSDSVQQTLYAMAGAALDACPAVASVTLAMPNRHRVPFDLRPLGRDNRNEVFVTTDEPFGHIAATVARA